MIILLRIFDLPAVCYTKRRLFFPWGIPLPFFPLRGCASFFPSRGARNSFGFASHFSLIFTVGHGVFSLTCLPLSDLGSGKFSWLSIGRLLVRNSRVSVAGLMGCWCSFPPPLPLRFER